MTWTPEDAALAKQRTNRLARECYEREVADPKTPWDELTPELQNAYIRTFGVELA